MHENNLTYSTSELWCNPLLAENYKPMIQFELLVGSVTRSNQFRLIAPATNLQIDAGNPVRFEWGHQNKAHPVTIALMNNRGALVFETLLLQEDTYIYILKTKTLHKGLYYWKIMIDDEMVIMGKLTLL